MKDEIKEVLTEELKTFKESLPEYVTPEDLNAKFDSLQEKIDANGTDELKASLDELRDIAEKQGLEMQKMNQKEETTKELPELISEKKEEILTIAKNGAGRTRIEVPKTLLVRAGVTNSTMGMRLPDVGQAASQLNVMRNLFQTGTVGPNSNGTIRYIDQVTNTRNAAWTAEAAQKPESAIAFQEYTLPIEKIADTIPVSMEMLNDVDFVSTEINNFLLKNLALKIDADLYSGSGVSPIIFGAYTRADEYTAVASGISDANIFDLIVKMQEDIATGTAYMPNYAVMNHATYNAMVLKKDANENYIRPPFSSSDNNIVNVNGIQIIISNSVTADTMLVGDFSYATLYQLGGLSLDFGYIDKQFVENTITLRAEERLGMLIRTAHTDAFRKETGIAAALVTLATAPA